MNKRICWNKRPTTHKDNGDERAKFGKLGNRFQCLFALKVIMLQHPTYIRLTRNQFERLTEFLYV
jgi:hypothetical protein